MIERKLIDRLKNNESNLKQHYKNELERERLKNGNLNFKTKKKGLNRL